jgi:hypothetical protein
VNRDAGSQLVELARHVIGAVVFGPRQCARRRELDVAIPRERSK